jgi:ribose transport system substrate-binding protein
MKIAVIPKGTTQEFWQSVKAGAERAGRDAGAEIVWKGPLKEDDRAQQIAIVEQFTSEHVSAIVLAPLDDTALVKPVQDAVAQKIPVIIFDSALRGEAGKDFVSFVATDNRKGGSLGGEALVKLLGGKGNVILFRYKEGSASTTEREEGFEEVVKRYPGLKMLVDNEYAGVTAAEAQKKSMNMLDRLNEADGIFCPNESSTFGMLLTLRQAGLTGKVKLVGFDASPPLIAALRSGEVNALVVQNPVKIGAEGVKAAVAAVRGEKVPPRIDTGVRVVAKGDLEDADVKKLLGI